MQIERRQTYYRSHLLWIKHPGLVDCQRKNWKRRYLSEAGGANFAVVDVREKGAFAIRSRADYEEVQEILDHSKSRFHSAVFT